MNMRERLARASAKAAGNFRYDGFGPETKAKYDRIADAVLDELMTPTMGMVMNGSDVADSFEMGPLTVASLFTGRIEAAKEGK